MNKHPLPFGRTALFLLLPAIGAAAQVPGSWLPFGGSGAGGGVSHSGGACEPSGTFQRVSSIAVDASGSPVVAWQNRVSGSVNNGFSEIYLRRWNPAVAAWEELAGSATGGGISSNVNYGFGDGATLPALALDAAGNPVVAWQGSDWVGGTFSHVVYLKRYSPETGWLELDGSAHGRGVGIAGSAYNSTAVSLALDSSGNPAVAWTSRSDTFHVQLKRWTGLLWEELDGSGSGGGLTPLEGEARWPSVAVTGSGDPVVAWTSYAPDTGYCIHLRRWTSLMGWGELGGSATGRGVSSGGASAANLFPSVAVDGPGNPVVGWLGTGEEDGGIYVRRWNPAGARWEGLGGSGSGRAVPAAADMPVIFDPVLRMHPPDSPVLAWWGSTPETTGVYVKAWNQGSGAWQELAGSGHGAGMAGGSAETICPSLALDSDGAPLVSWQDRTSGAYEIYVRRFAWIPAAPESPDQVLLDGVTPLVQGDMTIESGLTIVGRLGTTFRYASALEVELKPAGAEFTGEDVARGAMTAGDLERMEAVVVEGLRPATAYHWRMRAVGSRGTASPWVLFSADPEDPEWIDFTTRSNATPAAGAAEQIDAVTGAPVAVGGRIINISRMAALTLRATGVDADPGERVRIDVEIRELGEGGRNGTTFVGAAGPAGETASLDLSLPDGSYRWRFRAVDRFGSTSPWTEFGGNGEGDPDFILVSDGSVGGSSCLHSAGLPAASMLFGPALLFLVRFRSCRPSNSRCSRMSSTAR